MKRMASRSALLAVVVVVALLLFVPAASANYTTSIMYPQNNITYYEFVPDGTGTLTVTVTWAGEDGVWDNPVWPEAEVDGVIQGYATELFEDLDPTGGLYAGTNPQSDDLAVGPKLVGKTVYVGAVPYAGDVQFKMTLDWVPDSGSPTQTVYNGMAYGSAGVVYQPSNTGTWHSVLQYWPGSMNRGTGTYASDVYANWDDYVQLRDASTLDPSFDGGGMMANNWASYNMYSYLAPNASAEAVTDTTIPSWASGGLTYYSGQGYYLVAPEIWTAAKRFAANAGNPAEPDIFNWWSNISKDVYPMPGTLDWSSTGASAWYTCAFPNGGALASDKPAYFWPTSNSINYSHRNQSTFADYKASFTYKFYGTSCTWYYTTFNYGGNAVVTLDGGAPETVSQYSATLTPKVPKTWSSLANTAHTLTITGSATKPTGSLGRFLTHDAFKAKSDASDNWGATFLKENNTDGMTTYDWPRSTVTIGGQSVTLSTCADPKGAMAFTFSGTAIDWKFIRFNYGGQVRVLIDGKPVAGTTTGGVAVSDGIVNLYNATMVTDTLPISGLTNAVHTIFVYGQSTKPAGSLGRYLTHDAFVVGGTTIQN